LNLAGSVVAITGASAGIGRACALAFAARGARVVLGARRVDLLETLALEIRAVNGEALVVPLDVAEQQQVEAFVRAAVDRYGRLDVLVNNAGYGVRGTIAATAPETHEQLMRVNYMGTVYGCLAAVPLMTRQGSGVIINVSSIVGHRSLPTGGAYAATKAAQISLTEALRVELHGTGVHACSVHPVGTETEFGAVQARLSGDPSPKPFGPQQSAEKVARAIVGCAERPRPEIYPYWPSRAIVWVNAVAPGLVDYFAARAARTAGRI
jgi:NADP-dependent 3-hydroxy acid dehydrogenase YdfG